MIYYDKKWSVIKAVFVSNFIQIESAIFVRLSNKHQNICYISTFTFIKLLMINIKMRDHSRPYKIHESRTPIHWLEQNGNYFILKYILWLPFIASFIASGLCYSEIRTLRFNTYKQMVFKTFSTKDISITSINIVFVFE